MIKKKAYLEHMDIQNRINKLKVEQKNLREKAVNELRADGFTFDQIVNVLRMGKLTASKLAKKGRR